MWQMVKKAWRHLQCGRWGIKLGVSLNVGGCEESLVLVKMRQIVMKAWQLVKMWQVVKKAWRQLKCGMW